MVDRPTLFSPAMVVALLREAHQPGTGKTQTRRLASSPLAKCQPGDRLYARENCWLYGRWLEVGTTRTGKPKRTFELLGQRCTFDKDSALPVAYWGTDLYGFTWKPAMHQPRWASRLTLPVSAVRFQRLQDITAEDAIAEGAERYRGGGATEDHWHYPGMGVAFRDPREAYRHLWDSLHGSKPGEAWADNPPVVALTFAVHAVNIDAMEAANG